MTMSTAEALGLLTPDALRDFFLSKPPETPIGEEHIVGQCPVSAFFQEVYGVTAYVGNFLDISTFQVADSDRVDCPEWVQLFSSRVDDGAASEPFPILASEAGENDCIEPCQETDECAFKDKDAVGWCRYIHYRPVALRLAHLVT